MSDHATGQGVQQLLTSSVPATRRAFLSCGHICLTPMPAFSFDTNRSITNPASNAHCLFYIPRPRLLKNGKSPVNAFNHLKAAESFLEEALALFIWFLDS